MAWTDRASTFRALHQDEAPFRLVNAWDPLSARVLALAGAPAIGTTSFGVGYALGHGDGQRAPWPAVRDAVAAIVAAVDVPVTADIEAGWGPSPDDVAAAVRDVVDAGAVGINVEDATHATRGELFGVEAQAARIVAARDAGGEGLVINARCDVWFGADLPDDGRLEEATRRAAAYVAAGADCVFVPGLVDAATLRTVADAAGAPLNVMLDPRLPSDDELAVAGVRRISQGAGAFLVGVGRLHRLATSYLAGADDATAGDDLGAGVGLLGDLPWSGR